MTGRRECATRIDTLLGAVADVQGKSKIHFISDEANKLGKMDQISDALTVGRGYGLQLQRYYQRKARRKLKRGE